jgi:beta-lactamase class A
MRLSDLAKQSAGALAGLAVMLGLVGCTCTRPDKMRPFESYVLDYNTPCDSALQTRLDDIDTTLRARHGMTAEHTALGVLDLQHLRLAMLRPDWMEYAASVPKIGILLAWFQLRPESATNLDAATRHDLGLMTKASSNEAASRFSRELGLRQIQRVLDSYHFYDAQHGGGLWMGKHYGRGDERIGDPLGDNSHAATVRQLLRFYLMLEQGKLVSPAASRTMREIFASPDIPHDNIKFVQGLAGRDVQLLRKWGTWEDWRHDAAVITAPGRHYILVALTHHPKGDDYLVDLAREVDEVMKAQSSL